MRRSRARRSQNWKPYARSWGKILRGWRKRWPPLKEWSSLMMMGLDRMGEDEDDEEEEEEADDGWDAAAPSAAAPPPPAPPTTAPEEINEEGPTEVIPEQEAPVPHEVVLANAEPMIPLHLYHALMRDYEEDPLRLEDDFDDLDDDPSEGRSDMDEWFPDDGSNDRFWVIKSKS
jgi:hypothetical protein